MPLSEFISLSLTRLLLFSCLLFLCYIISPLLYPIHSGPFSSKLSSYHVPKKFLNFFKSFFFLFAAPSCNGEGSFKMLLEDSEDQAEVYSLSHFKGELPLKPKLMKDTVDNAELCTSMQCHAPTKCSQNKLSVTAVSSTHVRTYLTLHIMEQRTFHSSNTKQWRAALKR
jgi:hypothetical protein